jgi:hypothetical protein
MEYPTPRSRYFLDDLATVLDLAPVLAGVIAFVTGSDAETAGAVATGAWTVAVSGLGASFGVATAWAGSSVDGNFDFGMTIPPNGVSSRHGS